MDQLKRENERLRALVQVLQQQNDEAVKQLKDLRAVFEAYVASLSGN